MLGYLNQISVADFKKNNKILDLTSVYEDYHIEITMDMYMNDWISKTRLFIVYMST